MSINQLSKAIGFGEFFARQAVTLASRTLVVLSALVVAFATLPLTAQPLPTLKGQTCGPVGKASVTATGALNGRTKSETAQYQISADIHCDSNGHPQGTLKLSGLKLNGSSEGVMTATSFARLTSIAGAAPTAHLSGSCSLAGPRTAATSECHYWIMFSQVHRRPPDPAEVGIVAFSITQGKGAPVLSGAGRIAESGKIAILSTNGAN